MPRPFEIPLADLESNLEGMVDSTFSDLQSQFLVLPKTDALIDYEEFQRAYETLKRQTSGFTHFTEDAVWDALREDALGFVVLRTILGVSPPEWADLAKERSSIELSMGVARSLDRIVRAHRDYFRKLTSPVTLPRAVALVAVAIEYISRGAPPCADDTISRLDKVDTKDGLESLRHVSGQHVPYAVLLYERYLGRPFASYRDAVSEKVGDVMETAIEDHLTAARISFRKTKRAERISGFEQAPDFIIPDEFAPDVIIEAKITGDDGTARDKVSRILRLAQMRDERQRSGKQAFEVVACIDGRGFGQRRNDMRDMLRATRGKVFTLATLDQLIHHTRLRRFLPKA